MRITEVFVAILLILGILSVALFVSDTNIKYIGKMDMQGTSVYIYRLGYQYYICMQEINPPCFLTSNTLVCDSGSCIRASYIYNGNITR